MKTWLALLLLTAAAASSCGSEDSSDPVSETNPSTSSSSSVDSDSAIEARLAADLEASTAAGGLRYSEDEAQCVAEGAVEVVGAERLTEIYVSEVDFNETELQAEWFGILEGCIDLEAQTTQWLLAGYSGLAQPVAECVASEFAASGLQEEVLMSDYDPELNERFDAFLADTLSACS